jgi:pimeloyl-ACP methyl ester carboxylesterase
MPALTVPAGDTTVHVLDKPGGTPTLVLINGAFGTMQDWNRVVDRLGDKYRVVRFDARGRGKSGTSADYSLRAAVEDVGRVIEAAKVDSPVLVGWSHGATTAVRYAAAHPGQVSGLLLIDGAFPIAMFDDKARLAARAQFRRLALLMRIAAAAGRGARMSADQAADLVIEMDTANGGLASEFAALDCPAAFVLGSGAHSGAAAEETQRMRESVAVAQAASARVSVFATAPANHTRILSKGADIVIAAINEVTGTTRTVP